MNHSPSPGPSPTMGQGHRQHRQRSETPPAQPLSKRDKRRTALSDRLAEITMQFSTNRDLHYRQQLQAIQIDTALIMAADVSSSFPLDDRGEDIDDLVFSISGGTHMMNGDGSVMGGRVYAEFAREINDTVEQRDAHLVRHKAEFEKKMADLNNAQRFRHRLAEEEHSALSKTLRDRLINSITSKKLRLEKEKGALDIADSNAVLLHPNQFSIHNPASPGGMHSKRATRNRREAEDISFADSHKRKRRAADDDGSPAPSRRAYDNGNNTPVWSLDKARETAKQFETPLYSIEKLFTDKDLGMTYNHAALAAYRYVLDHPIEGSDNDSDTAKDTNGDAEDAESPDSPPTAAPMAREPSHATRSTRGAGVNGNFLTPTGIMALDYLTNGANYRRVVSSLPRLPPAISNMAAKRYEKESAISPASVNQEEWQNDWNHIAKAIRFNEEAGQEGANLIMGPDRATLDAACAPPGTYGGWFPAEKAGYSSLRDDGAMSRSNSNQGYEAPAMSRTGTEQGSSMGRRRRGI